MKAPNTENTIVDEANRRTYVILAPRVLTDGEIYKVIRQEILRRGSPLAGGETITLTVTSSGGGITSGPAVMPVGYWPEKFRARSSAGANPRTFAHPRAAHRSG